MPSIAKRSGRIRVSVPNELGVEMAGAPVTVGVPFPRGALDDVSSLRLVDEDGAELGLQVKETARWSKFGSIRWALCDFTADLGGGPGEFYLEYGPEARPAERAPIAVSETEGFPSVEAGRLRIDGGLWFDAEGDGSYVKVLDEQALSGAFVEHEDARVYRAPLADRYEVEESGSEKVVIRREGWYQEDGGDREFCKYITRYVIHRDSPVVRIFHTWIFTGDGNRDRIANMGWRFALAEGFEPTGFLASFGDEAAWESGDYLLQHDYEHFDIRDGAETREFPGGRATGAAAASGPGARLYFGAKDFWQNYPSELEFRDGALWFHNWPRHNRPAGHTFGKELIEESGPPAASSSAARYAQEHPDRLTRSEWLLNVLQLRYAHEGELLNFRMPDAFGRPPIWSSRAPEFPEGQPGEVNAQGVSRTEEMWLYLAPDEEHTANAVRALEGLNDEKLRGVVDPAWLARSDAMYEIHHQDWENFPEEERIFELLSLAPARWQERLGMYGMWLHGDLFAWGGLYLESKQPQLYRALRKAHHGWPYSWTPYARSGDSRLRKIAEASTRQMIDANYTHYVGDELRQRMEDTGNPRRIGRWNIGISPWSSVVRNTLTRSHTSYDQAWQAWYLTGYHRAKENVLSWAEHTKVEEALSGRGALGTGRSSIIMLSSVVETYKGTFDPWFLVMAHALGEMHLDRHHRAGYTGHIYNTGDREFQRFTGCPDFLEYYMAYADQHGDPRFGGGSWGRLGLPVVESQAFSWLLTGDDFYLRRAKHFADWVTQAVYDGDEPEYVRGQYTYGHPSVIFTGYGLQYFPLALRALADADTQPEAIGTSFALQLRAPDQEVVVRKAAGESVPFEIAARVVGDRFLGYHNAEPDETREYRIIGPDGEVFEEGEWRVRARNRLSIPAEAPAGDYRLLIHGSGFDVPVTDVDAPEVIVLEPGARMRRSHREGRYWFMVPEGVEAFYVDAGLPHSRGRISVWGPDGELVWNHNYHPATHEGGNYVRGDIPVEPGQAGRLWRITVPGYRGGGFEMDPQIPPVYATDRARWFMPEHLEFDD